MWECVCVYTVQHNYMEGNASTGRRPLSPEEKDANRKGTQGEKGRKLEAVPEDNTHRGMKEDNRKQEAEEDHRKQETEHSYIEENVKEDPPFQFSSGHV